LSAAVLPVHPPVRHVVDIEPTPTPAPIPPPAIPIRAPRPSRPAPPPAATGSTQPALINADRAAAGLPPLAVSPCLTAVAAQNAARMAAQGYISHQGGAVQDLSCHLGNRTGENIGYTSGGPHDALMNSWFMNDAPHRANILGPFHYVGAVWVIAGNGTGYLAVEFG
ncbi:MAG TPA: CAP domain-containing protein, partial [Candidatus Limnocylindrales bacterium]|nr:CAP domain-containing protein [Candidatus Limnocylindrales bacterium]